MREFSTPLTVDIPAAGNLTDDVVTNAAEQPDAVAFSRATSAGWVNVTTAEFLDQVRAVAKGLLAAGIRTGDRVGLVSKTRYEWTLLDYAIWFAGAVTVPIYETSSDEQVAWILEDSGATAVVAETCEHANRLAAMDRPEGVDAKVWILDDGAVTELASIGVHVTDDDLEARRRAVTPDSLATIIYTSGTTGRPKGCMLTHGNFMFEVGVAVDQLDELFKVEGASTLLFLPLAHVFARIIQVGAVKAGVRLGYSADIKRLLDDLESFRPTFILAVPRVFEKIFNTVSQNAAASGKNTIFDLAADTAIEYSKALDERRRPGLRLRARHTLFDKLIYARLRSALGGECGYAMSGGAPLGERLGHFYRGIGLVVLEGYGLTETTGAVTVNLPKASKIGSVGRPIGGTAVRIADNGELLVRGGQVFRGYWREEYATFELLTAGGWLRTGDLAELDDEGFVRITGRKKEIIVTAGGKNISPAALEDRIRAHPLVSQCLVVGDGRPFVGALVTIDIDALQSWARARGKPPHLRDLVEDAELIAEVQSAIDVANKMVSQAESVRRFRILPADWTEEGGHLTPSLKLRRGVVMREARHEVEALYGS